MAAVALVERELRVGAEILVGSHVFEHDVGLLLPEDVLRVLTNQLPVVTGIARVDGLSRDVVSEGADLLGGGERRSEVMGVKVLASAHVAEAHGSTTLDRLTGIACLEKVVWVGAVGLSDEPQRVAVGLGFSDSDSLLARTRSPRDTLRVEVKFLEHKER